MEERQSAIGTFMGISFLGQGLSMAIGGSIAFFLRWRGVFAAYSVLAALVTILFFTVGRKIVLIIIAAFVVKTELNSIGTKPKAVDQHMGK